MLGAFLQQRNSHLVEEWTLQAIFCGPPEVGVDLEHFGDHFLKERILILHYAVEGLALVWQVLH